MQVQDERQDKMAIQRLIRRYYITKHNYEEEGTTNPQHHELEFMLLEELDDLLAEIIEYKIKYDVKKN